MSTQISEDLAYLRDVAEAGEAAPSTSGRFALLWFGLLTITLMAHWAILRGFVPGVSEAFIGLAWMSFAIIGSVGSWLISRSVCDLPGQSAAGNKVDRYTWRVSGAGLFLFAIAIALTVVLRADVGPELFDLIMPAAFLLYAVNYSANAAFMKGFSKWLPVIVALGFAAVTIAMTGLADAYLASAVGVVALWSVGGYRQLREEPKAIV